MNDYEIKDWELNYDNVIKCGQWFFSHNEFQEYIEKKDEVESWALMNGLTDKLFYGGVFSGYIVRVLFYNENDMVTFKLRW